MTVRWISATAMALALVSCGQAIDPAEQNIATAESFVDAFYSFEQSALRGALKSAEDSFPSILYYQGWAEGGNYTVFNRMPCSNEDEGNKYTLS